jgi:hypothetical protein
MELDLRPTRRPHLVTRVVAGETVIVPVQRELGEQHCLYTLNEVGAFVWSQLDGQCSLRELAGAVAAEFETSEEAAERDLQAFLASLESERLIEVVAPAATE